MKRSKKGYFERLKSGIKIKKVRQGPGWVPMTPWADRSNIGTKVCDVVLKYYI
jgi:hypothetical protein